MFWLRAWESIEISTPISLRVNRIYKFGTLDVGKANCERWSILPIWVSLLPAKCNDEPSCKCKVWRGSEACCISTSYRLRRRYVYICSFHASGSWRTPDYVSCLRVEPLVMLTVTLFLGSPDTSGRAVLIHQPMDEAKSNRAMLTDQDMDEV